MISIKNIKSYLELEARSHAQDTATSLGLSISPYIADPNDPIIETMMNAIFDRGYYKEIKLADTDNKEIIKLENKSIFEEVPQWFKNAFKIEGSTASSMVSAGWMPGGTLYVTSNPGYGYLKLYQQAQGAFYYALVSFSLSMAIILLFLKLLLNPLKKIETLAKRIAEGKFETIKKLPWTTEIKNVANSMNIMSLKIEGVINKLNENLNNVNKKLKTDGLTGLELKTSFEAHMKNMFMDKSDGYIVMAKLDTLGSYAKNHTEDDVDNYIKAFSVILTTSGKEYGSLRVYRFHGSEFAIVAEKMDVKATKNYLYLVQRELVKLEEKSGIGEVAHFGGTPFNQIGTTIEMIASANEAYEHAKAVGPDQFHLRDKNDLARDMEQWRVLVYDIIDNLKFQVSYIGKTVTFIDNKTFIEEAFTQAYDTKGESIPIGTFISIAERYGKITDLDRGVVKKVAEYIESKKIAHDITVNLALSSLSDGNFKGWLKTFFKENREIAGQLVFSVTAYGAAKDLSSFQSFIEFVHQEGAKVMVKRFESQFIQVETLKELNLDYIRLARDYTNGVSKESGKQSFVESMKEIGELIGVKIFAESVKSDNDYETLKKIGIYGAGRS